MKPDDSETRWEIVPYFHGKVLDISEGTVKTFPHFIWYQDVRIEEPHLLGMFADKSLDGVVSSGMLNLMPEADVKLALKEWRRVVRDGGHIVLHLPQTHDVVAMMREFGGWTLTEKVLPSGMLYAFRLGGTTCDVDTVKPQKTAAVVRLGAFGDMIQASTLFPWFKENGYHLTLYCSDSGKDVVRHDPHIDRFIVQGRDEVPPAVLEQFWAYERKKYDKWVNLSESVEGTLLAYPGRANFDWPDEVRAKYMDRNYLEFTHEIAGVPPPYRPKFYSTIEEKAWARDKARSYGKRNVLWSLSGSSIHKHWPHLDSIIASLMLDYKDVHVVLVGDELCQILEAGWGKERRVHCQSGKWTIRQSMAFAEVADLIIGSETGLLNAAGSMDVPKIVTLSHSSENMLTKHWKNVIALKQPKGCPKFPCRQMHHGWDHCMRHETEGSVSALCQHEITPEMMWRAVQSVFEQRMVA